MNLIENAKKQIDEIINKAYIKACDQGILPAGEVPLSNPSGSDMSSKESGAALTGTIEIPRDITHGDYAATHAMAAAKALKLAPRTIAEALVGNIELENTLFRSVSIAGPGFINFILSEKWYGEVLNAIESMNTGYGAVDIGNGKKVMVEFVSANPTGPMTIGNARGGVLGDTLASILTKAGYDVWREFYVNDAGNQVELLGKSLNARYMQLCPGGENTEFPEDGYHGDDIREHAEALFASEGEQLCGLPEDERIRIMIDYALTSNIEQMKEHLERYRIRFDEWFRESGLHESGYVEDTLKLLDKGGLLYENEGALWLRNMALGAEKDEVMRRANGHLTYYPVDIAYHRDKLARGFDRIIDVLGADHHGHSLRMKASLSSPELGNVFGIDGNKIDFLIYQMVRLTRDGETVKVSKRTGKALTLNDLLDEISVDACRFFFNARPDSHLEFDLGLAVRQDSENPVYYVQYAHARICSLIANLKQEGFAVPLYKDIDAGLLTAEPELDLIKQLSALPEEIKTAARDYDPSRINKYVVELAARFHKFYSACRIKDEERTLLLARLKLADSTRSVIKNCLDLLGVTAPEKM